MGELVEERELLGGADGAERFFYRGTSLIRNSAFLGPYSRTMHRVGWWVLGGRHFLMSEVPPYGGGEGLLSQRREGTRGELVEEEELLRGTNAYPLPLNPDPVFMRFHS